MSTGSRVSWNEKRSIKEQYLNKMTAAEKKVIEDLQKTTGRSLSTVRRAVFGTLG